MLIDAPGDVVARDRVDGRWGDILVEVKTEIHGLRNFHAALMQLALQMGDDPTVQGLLVLVDPRISDGRLRQEVALGTRILREDVRDRISLAIARSGSIDGLPDGLGEEFRAWLGELIRRESRAPGLHLKRADAFSIVLELLVNRWFDGTGPVTTAWLMSAGGHSYPTVAKALDRLASVVHRGSDRSVELSRFPREEWSRLVARAEEIRSTMWFVDASGQPRSAEILLERLKRLRRNDIAVGGVAGARHHYERLDLVGTPRLDLSVHCPENALDLTFIEDLDPALERQTKQAGHPASLVVHCVRRRESLFARDADGFAWADRVECLLDLHEARLEHQAEEFVQFFAGRRGHAIGGGRP